MPGARPAPGPGVRAPARARTRHAGLPEAFRRASRSCSTAGDRLPGVQQSFPQQKSRIALARLRRDNGGQGIDGSRELTQFQLAGSEKQARLDEAGRELQGGAGVGGAIRVPFGGIFGNAEIEEQHRVRRRTSRQRLIDANTLIELAPRDELPRPLCFRRWVRRLRRQRARKKCAKAMVASRILGGRYAEEDAGAGSQPIHFAPEGLFLAGIWRNPHQLAALLLEANA